MVRKVIVVCMAIVACGLQLVANSQEGGYGSIQMPKLLPPSPDAFQITQSGSVPVGLFTGSPQYNIPLHELKSSYLNTSIGLSYNSNGVKVDLPASRAGVGWVMHSGGVISRTVVGAEDEMTPRAPLPPSFTTITTQLSDYFGDVIDESGSGPNADTEPDVYSFNFNGYSGNFLINKYGQVVMFPVIPNLKIEKNSANVGWYFKVTTPDGVVNYFGGSNATEKSKTHSGGSGCNSIGYPWIENSWYLTKMIHPFGDSIVFKYNSVYYDYIAGYSERIEKPYPISQTSLPCFGMEDTYQVDAPPPQYYLCYTRVTNDGVVLSEIESPEEKVVFRNIYRYDLPGDSCASSIEVIAKASSQVYKKIEFVQDFALANNSFVNSYITDDGGSQRLFLMGIKWRNAQTGGYDQVYSFDYYDRTGLPPRLTRSQDHFGYFNAKNNDYLMPSTGIYSGLFSTYGGDRSPDSLYALKGLLKKISYPTGGYTALDYEPNLARAEKIYYDVQGQSLINGHYEVGGMRVKRTRSAPDSGAQEVVKRYYYGYLNNLDSSSAERIWTPVYISDRIVRAYCEAPTWYSEQYCYYAEFTIKVLHSNSVYPIYGTSENNVVYAEVIVSDGESLDNGIEQHQFIIDTSASPIVVLGGRIPNSKTSNNGYFNGLEKKTTYYKKNGNQLKKVKEVENRYRVLNDLTNPGTVFYTDTCVLVNKKGKWRCPTVPMYPIERDIYDVNIYYLQSYFVYPDTVFTREYDPDGNVALSSKVVTKFDDLYNLQKTSETSWVSNSQTISKHYRYAKDFASYGNVYEKMVNANFVSEVIETETKRDGGTLYTIKTNYTDWFGNNRILAPSLIEYTPVGMSAISRIRYHEYSLTGNILEVSKENDLRVSYVWDKWGKNVLAEISGASQADIAVTSFEDHGNGNWTVTGGSFDIKGGYTGLKAYSLKSGNSISKSGLTNGTPYIVSYWSKNGSLTVNSGSGTAGVTRDGWTYYQHTFSNATSVTITGSAIIDELRLYPKGANVVSLTYLPGVGILSQCDANNKVSYYEYDAFNRLALIRDQDRNVLKRYCYNYAGQSTNCTYYTNVEQSQSFTRNNCSVGYIGSSVTYTVPAGKYGSTISQADADAKALAEIAAYGQDYANTNGTCTEVVIYARAEYQNVYTDLDYTTADVVLKFYSDEACTTPYSVTNLNVNYKRVRLNCGGWGSPVTISYTASNCNGYQVNLGNVYLMLDDGIHCYEYSYSTTAGTGYTAK